MSTAGLNASLRLEGFDKIPRVLFRRAPIRKAFRKAGNLVAKEARSKISARDGGFSNYPAQRTQTLKKSLRVRVSKSGFLVKVYHEKTAAMTAFYPAYLHYGTSRGVRPRDNWIVDALDDRRTEVQQILAAGADEALS